MAFFEFLQKHRLFVHYLTAVIVIFGSITLFHMQREARPNVNFNRVAVSAVYPGASPADIEELIIDPIEEKIEEVDGIEEYRSVAFTGAGSISIQIDDEYPNPQEVVDEIRRKISEVKGLPSEVDDPVVSEVKAINFPILRMALYGKLKPFELKLEVEKLKDFLTTQDGVQSVSYTGLEDLQLKVLSDPRKLDAYDVTLIEVMNSLSQWSKQRPGGLFESSKATANITVGYDYNDIEKLANFVLRSNDSGKSVRLSDFATVEYDTKDSQQASLYGDKDAVLLTIVKKPGADIIETVDAVMASVEKYSTKFPEGMGYKFYTDGAKMVRNRMSIVTQNAIVGLTLVLILLIVFLDWRTAVITSLGIPVAILGGITVVFLLGNTLNSLVLVGLIIVLGMLVDDAIVVSENIYSHLERGLSPARAALKGVQEIAIPILATVLTTVFAFFPILFMKEIIGQFLRVIPITVIAMLAVSLFEALVILPIHAEEIMRMKEKKKASAFAKLEAVYRRYLGWSLRNKWIVLAAVLVIFGFSILQGKYLFQRFSLFPATGLEAMAVRVELKKNTPIHETAETIKALSAELEKVNNGTFDSMYSTVGQVTTGGSRGSRQTATHLGSVHIAFTSDPSFLKVEKKVVADVRRVTEDFAKRKGVKTSITLDRPGPPVGKPIQLQVTSRDLDYGSRIVDQLKAELNKIEGVNSLETDMDGDSLRYRFVIDNNLAVSDGVNPSDISNTIFAASTGRVTSEILKNNEKVEILVSTQKSPSDEIDKILRLKVRNKSNQAVPIRTFTKVVEELGPSAIQRFNGLRTITLFGEVDEKTITGKEANEKIAPFLAQLKADNPTIKIVTGGGERDRLNALRDTMRLYILAVLLIFMVISLSFQSIIYPFMVLLSIPMGLVGVVWALRLHGQPLSLMGIIGVVGLSGVVVNVSIILLDNFKEKLREGLSITEAVTEAGVRRLRPIIITTLTTLIGLVPTIYGVGGVDAFVQPIALVLGWGLFVSTLLTVFALPALVTLVPFLKKGQPTIVEAEA